MRSVFGDPIARCEICEEMSELRMEIEGLTRDLKSSREDFATMAAKRLCVEKVEGQRDRLLRALDAASGYLLNAKIDLEAGVRKRTAIQTIEGGLKVVRDALVLAGSENSTDATANHASP